MEDLEVLCRECHEAHHSVDKIVSKKNTLRGIHKRAIFNKLKDKNIKVLLGRFIHLKSKNDLFIAINKPGYNEFANAAASLLGCDYVFSSRDAYPKKSRKFKIFVDYY